MKRAIIVILLVGVIVALLGSIGVIVVYVVQHRTPPISWDDMDTLQTKDRIEDEEIARLLECFDRNDWDLRVKAAETLGKVGARAVAPVREKLKDKNAKVRYCAAQALANIGPPAAPATDDLVACLKDSDADVRFKAVYALGKIGVSSEPALVSLVNAVTDPDETVQQTARETLKTLGPPPREALDSLTRLANHEVANVRSEAIVLLGKLGEPAVPVFVNLYKKGDAIQRAAIIEAAAPLGEQGAPLLPEFEAMMIANSHWDGHDKLLVLIKQCGPDGAQTLARVLKTVHDKKSPHFGLADTRASLLIKTIGEIGPASKVVVPTLVEFLKERETLRGELLTALGDIGPAASEAISAIVPLTKDPRVGLQAQAALKRIGVKE
jgi:HEAT repeat protein